MALALRPPTPSAEPAADNSKDDDGMSLAMPLGIGAGVRVLGAGGRASWAVALLVWRFGRDRGEVDDGLNAAPRPAVVPAYESVSIRGSAWGADSAHAIMSP